MFECFINLPPELRLMIWEEALDEEASSRIVLAWYQNGYHLGPSPNLCSPFLSVCRESRNHALKNYYTLRQRIYRRPWAEMREHNSQHNVTLFRSVDSTKLKVPHSRGGILYLDPRRDLCLLSTPLSHLFLLPEVAIEFDMYSGLKVLAPFGTTPRPEPTFMARFDRLAVDLWRSDRRPDDHQGFAHMGFDFIPWQMADQLAMLHGRDNKLREVLYVDSTPGTIFSPHESPANAAAAAAARRIISFPDAQQVEPKEGEEGGDEEDKQQAAPKLRYHFPFFPAEIGRDGTIEYPQPPNRPQFAMRTCPLMIPGLDFDRDTAPAPPAERLSQREPSLGNSDAVTAPDEGISQGVEPDQIPYPDMALDTR